VKPVPAKVPDFESLKAGLELMLGGNGPGSSQVTIRDRKPAVSASTYPSEVIECQLGRGERKLYCKYTAGLRYDSYGHRGGVPYEAEVYRSVLENSGFSLPKFYGAHKDPASGDVWLVLEYLEDTLRLAKGPQPESMLRAARWIGRFHAANERCASTAALSFLHRYDIRYFEGWVRRTFLFANGLHCDLPWLETICEHSEDFAALLLSPGATIIHGEYYPHNVLIKGCQIYPIDWESAAIAAGEIDLVTLTEGWPPEIVGPCEIEYQHARWPGGAPPEFHRRLEAARLYLSFRWLGEQPEWTRGTGNFFYFEQMRSAGEQLGLI
jgi:hypothetical protein